MTNNCPKCGKEYKMKTWLDKHIKAKHGEDQIITQIKRIEESKRPREEKLDEMYEAIRNFNESLQKIDETNKSINFEVEADYILIVGISDLHFGNQNVNMNYVERVLDFVQNNDRAYCFLNGDVIDNWVMLSPQGGIYDQTIKPEYQQEILTHKLKPLSNKILAVVYGNHEGRSQKSGEKNPSKIMAEQLDVAYLGAGGRINLHFPEIVYRMHIRHRFRYESSFNPTHACNRLIEQLDSEADIVAIGHKHEPAIAAHFKAGKQRTLIRFGSAMPSTPYSDYLGFGESPLVAPTIVLNSKRKIHQPFLDIAIAKQYLERRK